MAAISVLLFRFFVRVFFDGLLYEVVSFGMQSNLLKIENVLGENIV